MRRKRSIPAHLKYLHWDRGEGKSPHQVRVLLNETKRQAEMPEGIISFTEHRVWVKTIWIERILREGKAEVSGGGPLGRKADDRSETEDNFYPSHEVLHPGTHRKRGQWVDPTD